ncbi:MAG: hypothetical protein D6681_04750 [Calditrichaeota bacterium]|nr:MAG: hypothetical protein D6681_04750 [Calditrichota bacterium]
MLSIFQGCHGSDAYFIETGQVQLFIDDFLIESARNVHRTLHQPIKENGGRFPVIALEDEFKPYAATLEANGTILYDPRLQKYVMFALGYSVHGKSQDTRENRWKYYRVYRFTSEDGLHWTKGDNGQPQWVFPRSRRDLFDPVSGTYATNIDVGSYFYDQNDSLYPYKGWQHFSNWGDDREGQYFLRSPDGIHWERGPLVVNAYGGKTDPTYRRFRYPGYTLVGPQDVTIFSYDPVGERFLGIFKFYSAEPLPSGNRVRSRAYAFFNHPLDQPFDIEQITHVDLIPPLKDTSSETRFDEYYGSTGWRYESLWLGGLKVYHQKGDYPWSAAGCAFLRLIVSRDGLHWQKVDYPNEDGYHGIFIANGKEGGHNGQNDGGYLTEFSNPPLRIGDELIFYYGCSSWGKNHPPERMMSGGGIFRARLRLDGFVSVDTGTLTTRLLRTKENQKLTLNGVGPINVTLLDPNGRPIGQQSIRGDSLRHRLFRNVPDLDKVLQHGFRLRFQVMPGGYLYAFRVEPETTPVAHESNLETIFH